MANDAEKRALIIATQAAREAAEPPRAKKARRANYAASPPVAPLSRMGRRRAEPTPEKRPVEATRLPGPPGPTRR